MQMKAALLVGNPRDEEEDDLALLCCQGPNGETLLLSRAPDEEDVEVIWDEDVTLVQGLKVTLGARRLLIAFPADAQAPFSDDLFEADLSGALVDTEEVEQALRVILQGTGTLVME